MSKKDYQAIARAIHKSRETAAGGALDMARIITDELANVMAQDNSAFDRARFIEACETGTTRGMRK